MCSVQAQVGEKSQDARKPHARWERQFVKYVVVGVATNGGAYLLFYLFTALGLSSVAAISILYPTQLTVAFLLNRRWSFAHEGRITVTAIRYLIAYAACYVVNVAVLKLFADYLGFSHLIVQACAVVILAGLLFLVQRYWVFAAERAETEGDES